MKRILISWKSKNGIIMGAQVDDDVDVNIIQEELNNENPADPTQILTKYITKDNLDFFNPVDIETSDFSVKEM
jgi:hypothetical protein|tara:strand:+ start:2564 stop:2782 length:219 start_codon:yes stop_codon:yes gene_type:complete